MSELPLITIVPLRAGSRGLPGKNVRQLNGKPLYRHAVDQGLSAGAELCVISTDIAELLALDHGPRVQALFRPAALAADDTPMDPVLEHALRIAIPGPARIVLLQATSPLRSTDDISTAVALHRLGTYDLVMSVTRTNPGILKYGTEVNGRFVPVSSPEFCFMNRQALPAVFRPNGAVYVFSAAWFRANGGLASCNIGMIEIPENRSMDIDTSEDFGTDAELRKKMWREAQREASKEVRLMMRRLNKRGIVISRAAQ